MICRPVCVESAGIKYTKAAPGAAAALIIDVRVCRYRHQRLDGAGEKDIRRPKWPTESARWGSQVHPGGLISCLLRDPQNGDWDGLRPGRRFKGGQTPETPPLATNRVAVLAQALLTWSLSVLA